MRRFIPALILGVMIAAIVVPHAALAQRWDLRLYGGMVNSELYGGSRLLGADGRYSFAAGVAAEYITGRDEEWGFEFGLSYVDKGAKGIINVNPVDPNQPPGFDVDFEGEAKIGYLQIDALIGAYLDISKSSEIKLYIGPYLGNLVSAKAEGTSNGEEVDVDIKDVIEQFDIGITAGIGFAYEFEKFTLVLDGRAVMGAGSIAKSEIEPDLRTRTYMVLLGVEIPIAQ